MAFGKSIRSFLCGNSLKTEAEFNLEKDFLEFELGNRYSLIARMRSLALDLELPSTQFSSRDCVNHNP